MRSFNRRLRWLRFRVSLRTLFAVMLLIAIAISWYGSQTRRAIRQQEAVERIRQMGGHATFAYQLDSTRPNLGPPMPPRLFRTITGDVVMSDVVKVSWHAPLVGAGDTQILSELPRLRDLRLNMRRLTNDGIQPLESLTQLHRLDLWCSQVTDEALSHLAGLRQLRSLDLFSTQVTDKGLEHLYGLKNLKEVKLRGTDVTPQGAARLQSALPNCQVLGVDG